MHLADHKGEEKCQQFINPYVSLLLTIFIISLNNAAEVLQLTVRKDLRVKGRTKTSSLRAAQVNCDREIIHWHAVVPAPQ